MEDSEPPDSGILTVSLEEIEEDYNDFLNLSSQFIKENSKVDIYNKLEYDVLYRYLGSFYKLVVNTSYLDLSEFSPIERVSLYTKRKFAGNIKTPLSQLLIELEELQHPEEESPFYEYRKDILNFSN